MALPRLAFRAFTRAGSRATSRTFQRASRRAYSAGAAPETKTSSDLPWAIGSLAVTLPAVYLLMQPSEPAHVPTPAHEAQESGHKVEVTQPTPAKVESQVETAVKAEEPQASEAEKEGVEEKAETEQEEKKPAEPAMTEEKGAEEAKAEKAAEAPGEHAVVPDTTVQSTEAPSKKQGEE